MEAKQIREAEHVLEQDQDPCRPDRHWAASDANDFETRSIYREDAVWTTRSRASEPSVEATTGLDAPSAGQAAIYRQRIVGNGDLWVTEYILTYDGKPSYTVSIMEFKDDKVVRETQYFADPFEAPAWRSQWVERMA